MPEAVVLATEQLEGRIALQLREVVEGLGHRLTVVNNKQALVACLDRPPALTIVEFPFKGAQPSQFVEGVRRMERLRIMNLIVTESDERRTVQMIPALKN